jgi:metal-responsive CopG/Arc/MetJ family transcriptional regulator
MQRLLVSLPDDLYNQVERVYGRNKSKVIVQIFRTELKKREEHLRRIAREVEADTELNEEMKDWDVTAQDGLGGDETW